ncbi:MAG: TIGR03013 family PEP-CTERM/XrtA system glycosyltransferase [Kangiellaceae bacterium]|nr:TIGR03013 family PEP-CTERM/XrtA system glycosyltransferase [Kangiellaceae bacterium]
MVTFKVFNHHFRTTYLFLLLAEFALLFLYVYAAVYFRFQTVEWQPVIESLERLPLKAFIYSLFMTLSMIAMGQYQTPAPRGKHYFTQILQRVTISLILGSLGLLVVYYVFPEVLIGRGIFGIAVGFSLLGVSILRTILYHTVDGRALRRKILVLGVGDFAANILDSNWEQDDVDAPPARVLSPSYASYVIHGFVQIADEELKISEKYLVNTGDDLAEYCLEYGIDEVVLAINDRRKKMPVDALLSCKLSNINVIEFVAFWEREKGMLRLDMLNPSWMIFSDSGPKGGIGNMLSRVFDISLSFVILLFMLPLLIITAVLIYLESGFKGPIFYRQTRVGQDGRHFDLLKFRSMIVDAEKDGEAKWASPSDARITRIGMFIRKVRIDELPQLLNIFRGDMSIVGPRPERPEFVTKLEKQIPFFQARHSVKPGLAGWAQLKYPYGASEKDAYNKLQYDLYYVKNHSIFMDAFILLQTVEVILLGKGAR